jgi:hypothetical protein
MSAMTKVQFHVVEPTKPDSQEWYVRVVSPDGNVRRVFGFTSEEIAREWIAKGSLAYLRNLEKPWNPLRRREKGSVWNRAANKKSPAKKAGLENRLRGAREA